MRRSTAGIGKRNVAELEAAHDGPRRRKRIRLGADGRLHLEERQQVGEEQRLIGNARQRREDLLDVGAGLQNRARQQSTASQCVSAPVTVRQIT